MNALKSIIPTLQLLPGRINHATHTAEHVWVLPRAKEDVSQTLASKLLVLLEDVQADKGLEFVQAIEPGLATRASSRLISTISMEQYHVFHTLLIERAAEIMSANPSRFFGPKSWCYTHRSKTTVSKRARS